jgi:hypothetical protein
VSKEIFVPESADIRRVASLPRRDWRVGAEDLAARATDLLRTSRACPGCGQQRGAHLRSASGAPCSHRHIPLSLYTHQAAFLVEFAQWSGLLAPMGVGRGKTLSGFLSFTVGQSLRPMLVLQAGLIDKAKRNQADLSQFWKIPNWIKIVSYEVLGRVSGKEELLKYQPDMIVFDEVHKLKSRKAAVTKRVERYVMHHHTHRLAAVPFGMVHGGAAHDPALFGAPLPVHGNPLPTASDLRAPVPQPQIAEHDGHDGKAHDRSCELCKSRIAPKGFGPYGLRVIGMSGTITTQTPKDFAHIAHMCLPGGNAPVPSTYVELDRWHLALAASVPDSARLHPGAMLAAFCDARENGLDSTQAARKGYGRRLFETPGVVGTTDDGVKASLLITAHEAPPSPAIEDAFAMLRGDKARCEVNWDLAAIARGEPAFVGDVRYSGWKLPNGFQLVDGVEVYRHALELALGFYYVHDPAPPAYWLEARSYWKRFVRSRIALGKLDSELDVANAALSFAITIDDMRAANDEPKHSDPSVGQAHPYTHWASVRDSYKLAKKAIWICDSALNDSANWLHSNSRGILWTRHVAFGKRLSEFCKVPYFGQEGRDAQGVYLDDVARAAHSFGGPIIASLDANKTGRDLQFKWDKNLFTTTMADGAEAQQALARTHRDGQDADVVEAALLMGCVEHAVGFEKALNRARYIEDITTERQRLNFADVLVPSATDQVDKHGRSFRWNK